MRIPATLSVALLFVYYEVYRWIPLGRWNWHFHWSDANDQFYADLAIGGLLVFFAWSIWRRFRPGLITACLLLTVWVVLHALDWWLPYAHDDVRNQPRYSFYAAHTQILPVVANHYPPDAGHAVLDFILFPAWMLVLLEARRSLRISRS